MFNGILSCALFMPTIFGFAISHSISNLHHKFPDWKRPSSEEFFFKHQNDFKGIGIDFPGFSIRDDFDFVPENHKKEDEDQEIARRLLERDRERKLKLLQQKHESVEKEHELKQKLLERERDEKLKLLDHKYRELEHGFRERGFLDHYFTPHEISEHEDPYPIFPQELPYDAFKRKNLDILNQKLPPWENSGYIYDQESKKRDREFLHGKLFPSTEGSRGNSNGRGGSRQGDSNSNRRGGPNDRTNSNSAGNSNSRENQKPNGGLNINIEELFPRTNSSNNSNRQRQNNNGRNTRRNVNAEDLESLEKEIFLSSGKSLRKTRQVDYANSDYADPAIRAVFKSQRSDDFHLRSHRSNNPVNLKSNTEFSNREIQEFPTGAFVDQEPYVRDQRVKRNARKNPKLEESRYFGEIFNGQESAEEYLLLDGPNSSKKNSNEKEKFPFGLTNNGNFNKPRNGQGNNRPRRPQRPGTSNFNNPEGPTLGPPFGLGFNNNKEKFRPQKPGYSNSNNQGNSRPQRPFGIGNSNFNNQGNSKPLRPFRPGNSNSNSHESSSPDDFSSEPNSKPLRPNGPDKEEFSPSTTQQNFNEPLKPTSPFDGNSKGNQFSGDIPQEFIRVGKRPEDGNSGSRKKKSVLLAGNGYGESLGRDQEPSQRPGKKLYKRNTDGHQENYSNQEQKEPVTEKTLLLHDLFAPIQEPRLTQNRDESGWGSRARPTSKPTSRPSSRPSSSWYWPGENFSLNKPSYNQNIQNRPTTKTTTTTTRRPSSSDFTNIKQHPNIRLLPDSCGIALDNRIIGGTEAQLEEFPWMALLQHTSEKGVSLGFGCGGSLISSRYVLTAAHCIKGPAIKNNIKVTKVRLGEFDTSKEIDCQGSYCSSPPVDISVESIVPHPKYRATDRSQLNDIALIRLKEKVKSTAYINPICLPLYGSPRNITGKKFVVAGWGKTANGQRGKQSNTKQKVSVPGVSLEDCSPFYNRINIRLRDTQICAGGEKEKDSCQGDSGGPLMGSQVIGNQARWQVRGVVSFGPEKCGVENIAGVYTKVSEYLDWILDNMKP